MLETDNPFPNIARLWQLLCDAIRESQNQDGSTVNPIVASIYYREAAFSANVLSTNARLMDERSDENLAIRNFEFVANALEQYGVVFDEPIWTPRGEGVRKGSLPATVYLFDALESACVNLHAESPINKYEQPLSAYVGDCEMGANLFAHDALNAERMQFVHPVINTSLMANWIRSRVHATDTRSLIKLLSKNQREEGVWPYIFSEFSFERFLDKWRNLIPKSSSLIFLCLKLIKDRSFFFADFHHHAVTLQYLLKVVSHYGAEESKIVNKAWDFIVSHVRDRDSGSKALDFSWEPQPNFPRYSNFKDTTTYFIIMEVLFLLVNRGFVTKSYALDFCEGISEHILINLQAVDDNKLVPVLPYEGTQAEINLIFPRPAESVFHKGHLMANIVMLAADI